MIFSGRMPRWQQEKKEEDGLEKGHYHNRNQNRARKPKVMVFGPSLGSCRRLGCIILSHKTGGKTKFNTPLGN